MANTIDLSPATLEITNNIEAEEFDCAGMRTGPDAIPAGEPAKLHNEVYLPMFQTNVQMKIAFGDTVKLNVLTADEAAHYVNACEELGLTVNFL